MTTMVVTTVHQDSMQGVSGRTGIRWSLKVWIQVKRLEKRKPDDWKFVIER